MLRGVLLSVGVLVVVMVSTGHCQGNLTCLAMAIPASDEIFKDCADLISMKNTTDFCANATCKNYFEDAFDKCTFPCNPFTLACNTSTYAEDVTNRNLTGVVPPNLTCLFEESAQPGLGICQSLRLVSLTTYCTLDECYFVENGYNLCGFAEYECNPVHSGCSAYFKEELQVSQGSSQGGVSISIFDNFEEKIRQATMDHQRQVKSAAADPSKAGPLLVTLTLVVALLVMSC